MPSTITVGTRVDSGEPARRRYGLGPDKSGPHGTVEALGGCGFGGCRHGDRCATVRWDGATSTVNLDADSLVEVVG